MPAFQAAMLSNLAKQAFKAHGIKLPTDWKQPTGEEGKQYVDAFKPSELVAPPDPARIFFPATPNKYHVDAVSRVSKEFEQYIDGVCDAIAFAHSTWKAQARFSNLKVMAVSAIGPPGCLKGPELKPLILAKAPKKTKGEAAYSKAIATHVSAAFKQWQDQVTVPGLPWYPAFAAFPGPQAPPMPNVPTPLASCPSAGLAEMTPQKLKDGIVAALSDKKNAPHHEVLFDSVAKAVASVFSLWLPTQMVTNVLGKGPIPTFAPPFVPVGPVLAGDNLALPGHLAA
jgi:hypothetical protein